MTQGRFIAVVGPSGVGKDSVMQGLNAALPDIHLIRRVITRAPGLAGEAYDAATEEDFAAMVDDGAFALHWRAHGLRYGIPVGVQDRLRAGQDCLVNLSRGVLTEAGALFDQLVVLHITAAPATLAARLANRGRETEADIARRLAQANKPLPGGLDCIRLSNDGPLPDTIARAKAALYPDTESDIRTG